MLGLLCSLSLLTAQNLEEDIANINAAYDQLRGYQASLTYELQSGNGQPEKADGLIQWSGKEKKYFRMGAQESLQNERMSILADHDEELVLVQGAITTDTRNISQIPLDSLLEIGAKVVFAKEGNGWHTYHFDLTDMVYQRISFSFDPVNFMLREISYRSNPFVVDEEATEADVEIMRMRYTNLKMNPAFAADTFSEKRFLRKDGKSYALQAEYTSFQLYNYLAQP